MTGPATEQIVDWLSPAVADAAPGSGGPGQADLADLAVAVAAVLAGGREVLRHYRAHAEGEMRTGEKEGGDPVTEADLAADEAIGRVLTELRPGEALRSEESGTRTVSEPYDWPERSPDEDPEGGGLSGALWIVDPLDGTREFLERNGEFAVMVGLTVEGSARLGAVYRPDPGVLYMGVVGVGAWTARRRQGAIVPGTGPGGGAARGGREKRRALPFPGGIEEFGPPEPLHARTAPDATLRLLHSRSHRPPGLARLCLAVEGPVEMIPSGSAGLKCARIAAGEADLYVHPVRHLKEWDTCAPEAVLRGAGGRVGDCRGRPLRYGKAEIRQLHGLFAATPEAWERTAAIVAEIAPDGDEAGGS